MESVLSSNRAVSKSNSQSIEPEMSKESKVTLDFGNSPLSQEWKDRITKQLNDMPEVFAHHELNFG